METYVKDPSLAASSLLIVGECIRSVFQPVLEKFAENRVVLTSCPQSEGSAGLVEKLAMIIKCSKPKEMVVLTVDGSPHCNMLHVSVNEALFLTKAKFPVGRFVIVEGKVQEISLESIRVGRYLTLVERCIRKCPEVIDYLSHLSLEQQENEGDASTSFCQERSLSHIRR